MRKCIPAERASRGMLHDYSESLSSSSPSAPFRAWMSCDFFGQRFDLLDVPPWGMIIPGDTLEYPSSILFYVMVETRGMPAGTVVAVRWAPSGSDAYLHRRTLKGDEDQIEMHMHWSFIEWALNQDVLVETSALPPDGNPYPGESFKLRVKLPLEPGEINLADLSDGDALDPAKFPQGIPGRIEPIVHAEAFNEVIVRWTVIGASPDHDPETIYTWETTFPGAPGQPYEFVIPPEAYTGFEDPRFTRLHAVFSPMVRLTPWPGPQFIFSMGGLALSLPDATRT